MRFQLSADEVYEAIRAFVDQKIGISCGDVELFITRPTTGDEPVVIDGAMVNAAKQKP
jgi:hypothetical protein